MGYGCPYVAGAQTQGGRNLSVAVMFLRHVILLRLQDHALALWVGYAAWMSLDSFMMETKMTPTTMDPANTSSEGVKDP